MDIIHVEFSLYVYEASMVEHSFLSVVYAIRMRINYKIDSAAVMHFILFSSRGCLSTDGCRAQHIRFCQADVSSQHKGSISGCPLTTKDDLCPIGTYFKISRNF